MAEPAPAGAAAGPVSITGLAVVCAAGRGPVPLLDAVLSGTPTFTPVRRFDVSGRRAGVAAALPGSPELVAELVGVVAGACYHAGLSEEERAACPLVLAARVQAAAVRLPDADPVTASDAATAVAVADGCGLAGALRTYTCACVAASTAVADGAAMIASGRLQRVAVAAGYLVDADHFALFDAGRALADDGQLRPFSAGRRGMLLGDAVAAVVLESDAARRRRGAPELARLAGWGRAGDAYHVCQPHPGGDGLARAVQTALRRAGIGPDQVGYINAHGTGTSYSDAAESAALYQGLGVFAGRIPISSTKSVHGHALEASGLIELIVTVLALRAGKMPVNAGYLGPDPDCRLDVVLDGPRAVLSRYALSLNAAFGGANTALLVGAP